MSKFIESKLSCQFEDGKAFYEATGNEEDLLYCKKMLRPQIKEVFQITYHTLKRREALLSISRRCHGFRSRLNNLVHLEIVGMNTGENYNMSLLV